MVARTPLRSSGDSRGVALRRIKSGLALVGACAALAVVLPPLAGLLNLVAGVTLLLLTGYGAYRVWAFLEAVVEASRRPATVRRNLKEGGDPPPPARRREPRERELRVRPVERAPQAERTR
jgi:hypothetical protein